MTFNSNSMSAKCKSRCRFVEHVKCLAGLLLAEFARQFDSLRFTTGERRRRLSEVQVLQSDVDKRLQFVSDLGNVLEQLQRFGDVHVEDIGDRGILEFDRQRFTVVTLSATDGASHPDVGEKVHLQTPRAVAIASGTATAIDVETEATRGVSTGLGFRQLGEKITNLIKDFDVGARVAAGRSSDGRLIDRDRLVKKLEAFDGIVVARLGFGSVEVSTQCGLKNPADQRGFAASGNAGHANDGPEWKLDVDAE